LTLTGAAAISKDGKFFAEIASPIIVTVAASSDFKDFTSVNVASRQVYTMAK
jgi:hypothetical protein